MPHLQRLFARLFGRNNTPRNRRNRPVLSLLPLENREVPSISLVGTQLTIVGNNNDDNISITTSIGPGSDVATKITATRIETINGPLGKSTFTSSKTFNLGEVSSIRVSLGNGTNRYSSTSVLPSTVTAGSGNDLMIGGDGNDLFVGGDGNDTLRGNRGNDIMLGGNGGDLLQGLDGNDNLNGEDGFDSMFGGNGNDSLFGGTGNDSLIGEAGTDSLDGSAGNDAIWGNGASASFLTVADAPNTLSGGDGNDFVYGTAGNEWINGGNGNDIMYGGSGNDSLDGAAGDDRIEGDDGNDRLTGGFDEDTLLGENGNDTLLGSSGDDSMNGGTGNDSLFGDAGFDSLNGATGNDTLYGGNGVDVMVSIDGAVDLVFGGGANPTNLERDWYWIDTQDNAFNLAKLNIAVDRSRAVNVISSYKSYRVNNVIVPVTISYGLADLTDPTPQPDDSPTSKKDHSNFPLFGVLGPRYNDIDQGATGSCYFLARMSAMADNYPQYIRDMIVDLGDGTYAVRFYTQSGVREYVRVDADLWMNGTTPTYANLGTNNSIWAALVEKAWAIYRYGNGSYDAISGGNNENLSTSLALGIKDTDITRTLAPTGTSYAIQIANALSAGKAVILGGPAGLTNSTPMTSANYNRGAHIYMVHSVVSNSAGTPTMIRLYNLYGDPLIEITDFTRLRYVSSGAAIIQPL